MSSDVVHLVIVAAVCVAFMIGLMVLKDMDCEGEVSKERLTLYGITTATMVALAAVAVVVG